MNASQLFAGGTIALYLGGFFSHSLSQVSITVPFRSVLYAFSLQTCFFGLGALFGIFAFVYSLWVIPVSRTHGICHFGFSAVFILIFAIAFLARGQQGGIGRPMSLWEQATIPAWIAACLGFLVTQALAVLNIVIKIARVPHGT